MHSQYIWTLQPYYAKIIMSKGKTNWKHVSTGASEPKHLKNSDHTHWSTRNLHLGGAQFESRLVQHLLWLGYLWFYSVPPGKWWCTLNRPWPVPSKSFPIHPIIWCYSLDTAIK
jgi:hypothetical protein